MTTSQTHNPVLNNKHLAIWLLVVCALIFTMVVLGGVTRLTRSGLSMVEWEPIMGIVPPIGQEAWQETFDKYKQFPEYQKINKGMDLDEFKSIFWFEYSHRVLGRTIGIAFLVPFLFFLFKGYIRKPLIPKLVIMFILGGLQGVLGWYMVKSGLVNKPHVSQYRLTAHLSAALLIYGFMFWVALDLLMERSKLAASNGLTRLRQLGLITSATIVIMIMSGGFVAGTKAGLVFNTFPLMSGQWLPPGGMSMSPWYMNLFDNLATIQFNHRLIALLLFLMVPIYWLMAHKSELDRHTRLGFHALLIMLCVQVALGISTLLLAVPVWLGATHQAGALVLFAMALFLNHRLHNTA
ncbi:MAG: COX15/CtaA family protein [Proteobacteria bacterium]|nr:COX15/CtaA family protein [Pseudomonadota bacterium]